MEQNKFKKLDFLSELPNNKSKFFREHGAVVEEIVINIGFELNFGLVGKHCLNLQTLIISDEELISSNMAEFLSMIVALKNLKSVDLMINHCDTSDIVHSLKELENLQTLCLDIIRCDNLHVDLADLHNCVHLETLQIKSAVIKIDDLLDLKMLRCLRIHGGKMISNSQEIAIGLPALEELEIFNSPFKTSFPDCQKLRALHIKYTDFSYASCKWMSMKLKTLESLHTDYSIFRHDILSKIFSNQQSEWVLPALKDLLMYEDNLPLIFPWPYCPMLTSLSLALVEEFPKECIDWIAKHSSTLQSVELPGLSFGKNSFEMPVFPKLRAFRLNSSYNLSQDRFFNWISKHSTTMEILNIYGELDRTRLLQVISDCKNIRSFRIARTTSYFKENFFKSLFAILKKNGVTPDNPFKFKCTSMTLSRNNVVLLRDFAYSNLCQVEIDDDIGMIWEPYNEIA